MEKGRAHMVRVAGENQPLAIGTYQAAIRQMVEAIGPACDEHIAAAWYIRFYEAFQQAGISYRFFLQAFYERNIALQQKAQEGPSAMPKDTEER